MDPADGTGGWRFDSVEIDLIGRRLLRDGIEQPLEPKAFAVLALLAGQSGRAFSREALLDAVWGHRHITPGTLNRVITLIRHALGETADRPRYLHTVHGVGYRFDAAVEAIPAAARSPVNDPPTPTEASPAAMPTPSATAKPESPATPTPTPSVANAAWPAVERRRAPLRRWHALALLMLITLITLAWLRSLPPAPNAGGGAPTGQADAAAARGPPVLAVLPLRPMAGSDRGAEFADGLSEELLNLLAQIDGLRVISRTSSFQFRAADQPLPQVARKLGATHLLEGSVREDGERLRIALRLVEATSDRALWSERYDRDFRDIFSVQDEIAQGVATSLQLRLGLRTTAVADREDAQLYRRYLAIKHGMETRLEGTVPSLRRAIAELRVLVGEHPDYARGWGALATSQWLLAAYPLPDRVTLLDDSAQAAAVALQLDPAQPDVIGVSAGQACREQRWTECLAASRRVVREAPADGFWRSTHARHLATLGYVEEALREQEETLRVDPLSPIAHFWMGRLLDTLGRHEEALPHLTQVGPPVATTALLFNAFWRGDLDAARRAANMIPADAPWRASTLQMLDVFVDPAALPRLDAAIESYEREAAATGHPVVFDFMRLLRPDRDYARDVSELGRVQTAGFATYHLILWMPRERALRQTPAFHQYLRSSGILAYWREHGWPDLCRSDGAEGAVCD